MPAMASRVTHVNMPATRTNDELDMASTPIIEDPSQASRRAKVRIGIAVTLLVTAVGILASLNQHKASTGRTPAAAPPAQTSISSQEKEQPAEQESTQLSAISSPPPAEEPSTPAVPETPPPPTPGKLPAAPVIKPQPQLATPAEKTGGHTVIAKSENTGKPAPVVSSPTTASVPELTKNASPKEFEVQLGVFGDMENARQLQTKLAEHGIPSHTETRVQVGPFKTRAEADQAREKLKALGITAVIAPK